MASPPIKMKTRSAKVDRAWLKTHLNDPWVKLAAKDGFRARAVYKLREIDETLGLLKPGQVVVDLGSAPGAWSQYLSRRLARRGTIIALDLLPMAPIEGVAFLQGDFREADMLERLELALAGRLVDVVLSDMAPNLSGIAAVDDAGISHLVELALAFAQQQLTADGALVVKAFHGAGYEALTQAFREQFCSVKRIKPKASRDKSSETFLVGLKLRRPRTPANRIHGA